MNKLQKATIALRHQLDRLETLVEASSKNKESHRRLGKARQHATAVSQRRRARKKTR